MIYLNLGCGNTRIKDCINIDTRKECNPDLISDIKKLPYKNNSIDGIYALDVLEHIPRKLVLNTLNYWYNLLKVGGFLIIRLPNVKKISERYINKEIDCNEFSRLIYGGQEQNNFANFHKSGFDKDTIIKILEQANFKKLINDTNVKCNINNMLLKFGK